MIGENRQLVTDEPVEFENIQLTFLQDCRKALVRRNLWNIPQLNKGEPEDVYSDRGDFWA